MRSRILLLLLAFSTASGGADDRHTTSFLTGEPGLLSPDRSQRNRTPSDQRARGRYRAGGGRANHPLDLVSEAAAIPPQAGRFGAQPSVESAFAAYLDVLRRRNQNPELGVYSSATRGWLRGRRVTAAQQHNELSAIEGAYPRRLVRERAGLAVVSFPDSPRVPPYFFRLEREGWTIDLASAARILGFDHLNRWHIRDKNSEFAFGL